MGTLPSCHASSKNVQVLDQPSPGANRSLLGAPSFGIECEKWLTSGERLHRAVDGFAERESEVLNERIEKHAGRINGKDNDFLSSQREPIPFSVRFVVYAILLQRAKISDDARKRLRNVF